MIKEFREFIQRGNLIDLAVAFVMGVAFAGLVNVFINRIFNPIIGMIFSVSSLDNTGLFGKVDEATGLQSGSIGAFIGSIINFLVVAFVMFLVVKAYNRMKKPVEETASPPTEEITLLREIRDSLSRR
ncbi:MAG: large conductance mechanosensitive channel protein MscL [Actinomycetota bacterium]